MEEYKQLIPALAKHAGKSRFLIIPRQSLGAFPYVESIPLFELDQFSLLETSGDAHSALPVAPFDRYLPANRYPAYLGPGRIT